MMKTCKDMEVCQPSQTYGRGNPAIIESGASTGRTNHHLVKMKKEIMVSGRMSFQVRDFMLRDLYLIRRIDHVESKGL